MALIEVAVLDCTLKFQNSSHSGTIVISTLPSTNTKVDNNGVYAGVLTVVITAGTDGSITNATGTGTISPTALFVKIDGQLVIRKGDSSIVITMTGTNPSPPPTNSTYLTTVEIDDPNQTSTKAD